MQTPSRSVKVKIDLSQLYKEKPKRGVKRKSVVGKKKQRCNKIIKLADIDFEKIKYDKKIDFQHFREFVKNESFVCIYNEKKTLFTYKIEKKSEKSEAKNKKKHQVVLLSKADFTQLLLNLFGDFIKDFCQNTRKGQRSVKHFNYKKFKLLFPVVVVASFGCLFLPFIGTFLKSAIILYYSTCIILKSAFLIYGSIKRDDFAVLNNECINDYSNEKLPKYTILVPMFKENEKTISQALNSLKNLVYPQELLDIKLVLEEDDLQTRDILKSFSLPNNIVPIWTPYFEPRTKPKACNVASLFAEGEILVIYDAEDIPEKLQLLKACEVFKKESNTQILQGCLNFYNYRHNILTECFNIEYNVWFKIALQEFAKHGVTIPLGGTSNHIKYNFLEKHGFWDSYNVTEDLELSVVADRENVKISHLNCDTKEWCVVGIKSFIKQRTRWLKGYLLTYLLYFAEKRKGVRKWLFIHLIVGYGALSFLFTPFLFLSVLTIQNNLLASFWFLANSIYYLTYIFLYASLLRNADVVLNWKRLFIFAIYPFYFILHVISSYCAIYDIYKNPFRWAKTSHLN